MWVESFLLLVVISSNGLVAGVRGFCRRKSAGFTDFMNAVGVDSVTSRELVSFQKLFFSISSFGCV